MLLSEAYDPDSDESLPARIVRLVAVASDRNPIELEPLGHVIDADALGQLVGPRSGGTAKTEIEVSFDYEGYRVEIDANGTVCILVEEQ